MKINFENNFLAVDNYKQIIDITSDLITLEALKIVGSNLRVLNLDPYRIVITGVIRKLEFGDE